MAEKNLANVSTDRIFKLSPINEMEMMSRKRSTFMFQGDKQLHAIQDSGLWYLEYRTSTGQSGGNLPEPLKQRWTSFNQLTKFLIPYFQNRGVRVDEIIA